MSKHVNRPGMAVKALGNERIGGYLVGWGSRDIKDLQGDYFTPSTNFQLDWYDRRPVLYHHGLDGEIKSDPIGVIDTIKPDDVGLWVEAQITARSKYAEAVKRLIDEGILAWSSGSLEHLVERGDDGEIKRWVLVEGSLTPTPAEPRFTSVSSIKAIYDELGINLDQLELQTDANAREPDAKERMSDSKHQPIKKEDLTTMTREEIMALIKEELNRYMDDMKAAAAEAEVDMDDDDMDKVAKAAESEVAKMMDEDDDAKMYDEDKKSLNTEVLEEIITKAMTTHADKVRSRKNTAAKMVEAYAAKAIDQAPTKSAAGKSSIDVPHVNKLPPISLGRVVKSLALRDGEYAARAMKAQNNYSGPAGGYLVGTEVADTILDPLRSEAVAFDAGVQRTQIQGIQAYMLPKMTTAPTAFRPGINEEIGDSTAKYAMVTGVPKPIGFRVLIPRQMLMNAPDRVQAQIEEQGRKSIDLQVDKEIFIGEGTVEEQNTGAGIRGILSTLEGDSALSQTNVKTLATNGREFKYDDFVDAQTQLANLNIPDSASKAFVMHPSRNGVLRKFTDANGNPLFRGNISDPSYNDIIGHPIMTTTQIPTDITTGTSSSTSYVFFGAFQFAQYLFSDQMELIVNEISLASKMQVEIIGYMFSDLIIHHAEAFYVMKGVK